MRTGFGAPAGFFVMWSYWISTWVTNATISVAAVSYLSALAPEAFARPGVAPLAAIGFVLLFSAIACRGARVSGGVQIVTSVLKLLPLIAAIVITIMVVGGGGGTGRLRADPGVGERHSGRRGAHALGHARLRIGDGAGRQGTRPRTQHPARDPDRNARRRPHLSRRLERGLPAPPARGRRRLERALRRSGRRLLGRGAASLVAVFAAISCLGALNGWVMLQAEVPFSLARRGVFPSWFARVNRRGVPVNAQLMGSALTTALIAANYTRGLTDLFAFMALLATAATLVLYLVASLVALRLIARGLLRGVLLAALACVGAVYSLWTLYGAGKEAVGWGAVLLATGVPVYFIMRSANRSSRAAAARPAESPESAA